MSGTKAGGLKAAQTNRQKYGKEFYSQIGRKGGQNGHTGGFAANPALARIAECQRRTDFSSWSSEKSCLIYTIDYRLARQGFGGLVLLMLAS